MNVTSKDGGKTPNVNSVYGATTADLSHPEQDVAELGETSFARA